MSIPRSMRRPAPGLTDEDVNLVLDHLRSDWPAGQGEAKAALRRAQDGKVDRAALAPLRSLFHRIAGLMPSLGWRELGFIAQQAEQLCQVAPADPSVLETLRRSLDEVTALVEEALGTGTEGDLLAPVGPAPVMARGGGAFDEAPSGPTIVVVDDDQATALLISGLLGHQGYRVVTCTQPDEALEVLEREQPALTVLDVMMPSVDGFELCRRIRGRAAQRYMPILFLSAAGSVEERITGLAVGGDDFLAKPFAPGELLARVRNHLQRVATLREMSIRDALTRTFNRGYFDERLRHEAARSERHRSPFALAMLDIDHFKQVNDTHGHQAGDAVLVQTAQVLASQFRATDIISRYGGEEFAVILLGTQLDGARSTVGRACAALASTPLNVAMPAGPLISLTLTLSAGVAGFTRGQSHDVLVARADRALYAAKANGRNQIVVDDSSSEGHPQ